MSTAERAPGPWAVEDAGTTWVVKRPGSSVVFMTRATKEAAEKACAEANDRFARDRVRDAAPDLLAALKAILPEIQHDVVRGRGLFSSLQQTKVEAAIAKAEGR